VVPLNVTALDVDAFVVVAYRLAKYPVGAKIVDASDNVLAHKFWILEKKMLEDDTVPVPNT
jgi:hypothetical protein